MGLDKSGPWTILGKGRPIIEWSWSQRRSPRRNSGAEWGGRSGLDSRSRRGNRIFEEGGASARSASDGFSGRESVLLRERSFANGTTPIVGAIRVRRCGADCTRDMRAIPWLFCSTFTRRVLGIFVHDVRERSTKGVERITGSRLSRGRLW
jgi:hypothetical protein